MVNDVASPGGWLNLLNTRIARRIGIGLVAAGTIGGVAYNAGQGVSEIYGKSQGAQAAFYCEAQLEATSAKGVTSYSCLNPLPENLSGAVLAMPSNIIMVAATASPQTRLNICTASGATDACSGNTAGTNIASGILLTGAKRILSIANTGTTLVNLLTDSGGALASPVKNSLANGTPYAVLAPRNYPSGAKNRLNFTFQSGSGQITGGDAPASFRIEVVPCNLSGVGC